MVIGGRKEHAMRNGTAVLAPITRRRADRDRAYHPRDLSVVTGDELIETGVNQDPVQAAQHSPDALRPPRVFESAAYARLRSRIIAHDFESPTIVAVKSLHTLVFLSLLSAVLHITFSGVRGRITHRTRISMAAVSAEALVFGLSGRRCPLTIMVEDLGAEHGQVTDIFLPDRIARHIFGISTTLLGIGAAAFGLHRIAELTPPASPRWR
jgi:hypothetical protein